MMFLVIANVPLLYFLNKDWFHTLIFTTPGKIALAICAAIILFAFDPDREAEANPLNTEVTAYDASGSFGDYLFWVRHL